MRNWLVSRSAIKPPAFVSGPVHDKSCWDLEGLNIATNCEIDYPSTGMQIKTYTYKKKGNANYLEPGGNFMTRDLFAPSIPADR